MPKDSGDVIELTINLRGAYATKRLRRGKRAVNILRERVKRLTGAEVVKVSEELNKYLWTRGVESPPKRVAIVVERGEEDEVTVRLKGEEGSSE
ncbi:MAG: 60S ribosomal protein L31 [Aigarchaeota archaeon]|nr:60S ribosomal protein L31 [Aigarchaeota archaeon]MDW8092987.1 50S ribosomal protein L31e [Nitrososphaerota archaeon]